MDLQKASRQRGILKERTLKESSYIIVSSCLTTCRVLINAE